MKRIQSLFPIILFLFITCAIFRPYFFNNKVPFAGNLLVAFYEPWKSYPFPGYPQGPANKPIGFDSLKIYYPFRQITIDSFKNFRLPLWNPYAFAGNTHLATYQSAVFFPLTPLFFMMPFIDAWSLIVILGPLLAAIFTFYFLRSLNISVKGSVVGALSFGFSGTMLVLAEETFMSMYSILFLPLILLGIQKMFAEKSIKWLGAIIAGVLFSILSGWFQSSLYALVLSFCWTVFLVVKTKQYRTFFYCISGFVIAFLLSGPHLIPNIESYFYSARGTTDAKFLFDWYLVQPWHVITYLAPDFFGSPGTYNFFGKGFYYEKVLYVGVVGFILGLISIVSGKKSSESWFFSVAWIITLSLGFSLPTSWFVLYNLHLPFLSTILPSRIFLLTSFCLSVLAAYGWEILQDKKIRRSLFVAILIVILMLLSAWIFVLYERRVDPLKEFATVSFRNLILPSVLSLSAIIVILFSRVIKIKYRETFMFYSLLLLSIVGIIYFSSKYFYFSERRFIFPANPVFQYLSKNLEGNRYWSYGPGYLDKNFGTYYHLESPEGYDSLFIKRYGEFIEATKNKGQYTNSVIRADAQLISDQRLSEIGNNPYLLKALDLLGVTYLFAKENPDDVTFASSDPTGRFAEAWSDSTYTIFKNTKAFPRTFLVDSYIVTTDPKKTMSYMFDPSIDLRTNVVLDKNPRIASSNQQISGSAVIESYKPEEVKIKVETDHDAILFLSDNYYPGWNVYVDGKKGDLLRADYTFRGVVVKKGKHDVIFIYEPFSVTLGFVFFGVGALLFVGTGFIMKKRLL